MGYTTDFEGSLKLSKRPSVGMTTFLADIAKLDHGHEFHEMDLEYYSLKDKLPDIKSLKIPNSYLKWKIVKKDNDYIIKWDGNEKFDYYEEWLQLVVDILLAENITLSGSLEYQGEELSDRGTIRIEDGKVIKTELSLIMDDMQNLLEFKDFCLNHYGDSSELLSEFLRWKKKRSR